MRQGHLQRHVTTQRVAAYHGLRDVQGIQEPHNVATDLLDGGLGQVRLEDGQRQGDRATHTIECLERLLPMVHVAHQPMQEHDGLAVAALKPSELGIHGLRVAHVDTPFGGCHCASVLLFRFRASSVSMTLTMHGTCNSRAHSPVKIP